MDAIQAIFPANDCTLLAIIIGLPLIAAFVNGVFGKRLGKEAVTLMALSAIGASFCFSVLAFLMLRELQTDHAAKLIWTGWEWFGLSTVGEITAIHQGAVVPLTKIDIAFSVDALSGTMALIVTGVGFLIHLYSTKYMEEDPGYYRFFAYLNLFVFSMLVLILGDSLPVLFIGWEGVGLCSYLLIGFWFPEKVNAIAGKKAFITNRIGDFGLIMAMALLLRHTGSLSWTGISASAGELLRPMTVWQIPFLAGKTGFLGALGAPVHMSVATLVGLAAFLGCAGKSAQIPLYVWLPDAMAGPTPVSALIHAATMVTAGVYLVCRMAPVFVLSPAAMFTIAIVGSVTALLAASIALVQNDIKKVLAYSTVSQLGYMFMGVGVGAFTAGFYHVITHAFFKACLFLGAGSVIHAMHARVHDHDASQDMRNMGGLRKHMPITAYTFLISCFAIAGFPGFSGYFSKDEILKHALSTSIKSPIEGGMLGSMKLFEWPAWGGTVILIAGLLGAVMTAFYMFRLYLVTFEGDFRGWKVVEGWQDPGHGDEHAAQLDAHDPAHPPHDGPLEGSAPHEAPWGMWVPLAVLAFLAAIGGIFKAPLDRWLEPVFAGVANSISTVDKGGVLLDALPTLACFAGIGTAWYFYQSGRGAPAKALAERFPGLHRLLLEKWQVDEFYDEFFIGTVDFVADACVWIDKWVVDGIIARFTAWVVAVSGHLLRLLQTGRIQAYAAAMMIGTAGLGWFFTVPQPSTHVVRDDARGRYTIVASPGLGYGYRWDADGNGTPDDDRFGDEESVEIALGPGESKSVGLEVRNAFGRIKKRVVTVTRNKPEESDQTASASIGSDTRVAGLERGAAR